jgi:cytochrome c
VIGRRVGGDPEFDYSPALQEAQASGRAWDRAMLLRFLADPEEMFPGLWMGSNGLRDAAEREAIAGFVEGR